MSLKCNLNGLFIMWCCRVLRLLHNTLLVLLLLLFLNIFSGCVLTVGALSYGLFSFIRGNAKMQQQMMRARVLAQGSTVIAIIAGLGYELYLDNKKKK